ncbi:MAG: hypothetical protein U0T74_14490 [Chitinophagales bacterium]
MLQTITKENFHQLLGKFSTHELEHLLEKFPYFQQAHLLLAKKYQLENSEKFDQQLQLAALYTNDRELFYSIFNDQAFNTPPTVTKPLFVYTPATDATPEEPTATAEFIHPVTEPIKIEEPASKDEVVTTETKLPTEFTPKEEPFFEIAEEIKATEAEAVKEITVTEIITPTISIPEFAINEPHTFDEWLHAFSLPNLPKIESSREPAMIEPDQADIELERLYLSNIPVLVEEETRYSKGLDKFIEEQIQRHRQPDLKTGKQENEISPDMATETMAKVYESQKKYSKAIQCYEILTLKYPEKSDLFAARINYLKNIL